VNKQWAVVGHIEDSVIVVIRIADVSEHVGVGIELVGVRPPWEVRRWISETFGQNGIVFLQLLRFFLKGAFPWRASAKAKAAGFQLGVQSYGQLNLAEPERNSDLFFLGESGLAAADVTVAFGLPNDPLTPEKFETLKKSGFSGLTPAGVVICGGGAQTIGIVDSAKRTLNMPVRVGIPTGISGLIDDIEGPAFATSVGLLKYAHQSQTSEASSPSLPSLPISGVFSKIKSLIKSLLP
jgi:hypothetical protein